LAGQPLEKALPFSVQRSILVAFEIFLISLSYFFFLFFSEILLFLSGRLRARVVMRPFLVHFSLLPNPILAAFLARLPLLPQALDSCAVTLCPFFLLPMSGSLRKAAPFPRTLALTMRSSRQSAPHIYMIRCLWLIIVVVTLFLIFCCDFLSAFAHLCSWTRPPVPT